MKRFTAFTKRTERRIPASVRAIGDMLCRLCPPALRPLSEAESQAAVLYLRKHGIACTIIDAFRDAVTGAVVATLTPVAEAVRGRVWRCGYRYPAVLLGYVLLVFSAEYAVITAVTPRVMPPAVILSQDAPTASATDIDVSKYYPSALDLSNPPEYFCSAAAIEQTLPERNNATGSISASGPIHPLLATTRRMFPPRPSLTAVHGEVHHHIVRMPVDKLAFHPLDKERFLEFASKPENLRPLFASVKTKMPDLASLEPRPETAIAPPVTRLDLVRAQIAKRRELGKLCALFESGIEGVHAIGYDPEGGTSYGKYQLSSRKGTIRRFISYLGRRAPSLARRLKRCGPANTLGTSGKMPKEWELIADQYPRLFERLQDDFIHNNYYTPSLRKIRSRMGIDLDMHPVVLRELLWSIAVQHGPSVSTSIFEKAEMKARLRPAREYHRALINEIFREREKRVRRHSHPLHLRSLIRRLREERTIALGRLDKTVYKTMLDRPERGKGLL